MADESCQEAVISMLARFPPVQLAVRRKVLDGDTVAVLATATGTHSADMPEYPANGKSLSCRYQKMCRVAGDRIADL